MGSGVYAGAFTLEHALAARDARGPVGRRRAEGDRLRRASRRPASTPARRASTPTSRRTSNRARSWRTPASSSAPSPARSGSAGTTSTVTGQEAHAGPTPMRLRRDALLPAGALVARVNQIAMAEQPNGRGTVGCLTVHPNSRNVIPGRVSFTVDFRHGDDAGLMRMHDALHEAAAAVERDTRGIAVDDRAGRLLPAGRVRSGAGAAGPGRRQAPRRAAARHRQRRRPRRGLRRRAPRRPP